jgi:hypothetical protein
MSPESPRRISALEQPSAAGGASWLGLAFAVTLMLSRESGSAAHPLLF